MPQITFTNTCSIPEWLPEAKKNFRKSADRYIGLAIGQSHLQSFSQIEVTYFQKGVGSIVAKIRAEEREDFVIKIAESSNQVKSETNTYKALANAGSKVRVPKVYFDGECENVYFLIMEYFPERTLLERMEASNNFKADADFVKKIVSDYFVSIKDIKGSGYGWAVALENGKDLVGNFSNIDDFLNGWFAKKEYTDVLMQKIPSVDWAQALESKIEKVKSYTNSDICMIGSFDHQIDHFFDSNPPAFFDFNPRLEPEYFDLANLIIPSGVEGESVFQSEVTAEIFKKYVEKFGEIDMEKLKTAFWLQVFRKGANLLANSDGERLKRATNMLGYIKDEAETDKYLCLFRRKS